MFLPDWNKGELIVELAPGNLAGSIKANIMIDTKGKEIKEKDIDYYFTDMDLHVTIRKDIILSQKTNDGIHNTDSVLSLSASTVFPKVEPAKIQCTLLSIKNYARELNRNVDKMFLQCAEKANNSDDKGENSNPKLKSL